VRESSQSAGLAAPADIGALQQRLEGSEDCCIGRLRQQAQQLAVAFEQPAQDARNRKGPATILSQRHEERNCRSTASTAFHAQQTVGQNAATICFECSERTSSKGTSRYSLRLKSECCVKQHLLSVGFHHQAPDPAEMHIIGSQKGQSVLLGRQPNQQIHGGYS
jgi:hypothetical protein